MTQTFIETLFVSGLNSGVLLLNLERQRTSRLYQSLLKKSAVAFLCDKYQFHGHLGDQVRQGYLHFQALLNNSKRTFP